MKRRLLNDLIHIVTGIAVVIGLLMVFYELRQTKSLAFAEIVSEAYGELLANRRTVMGENPAPVLVKACYSPESLTREEHYILSAYYSGLMSQVWRMASLENIADFGVPWEAIAPSMLRVIMATPYGVSWLERLEQDNTELSQVIAEMEVSPCWELHEKYLEHFRGEPVTGETGSDEAH